jgi:hypothetical protein
MFAQMHSFVSSFIGQRVALSLAASLENKLKSVTDGSCMPT